MSKRDEAQCSSKSSSNTDAPPKEPDVVPPVLKKSKKKVFIEDVRDKTLKFKLYQLFPKNDLKPDDLFGEVLNFVEDQYGDDVDSDVFKDCPIYIVVEIDNSGKEDLLFVVVMDAGCVYTNDEQEETFATIIHCVAEVEGHENYMVNLEKFLLEIVRLNDTKSLFLSGAFPINMELGEFSWLKEDGVKRDKRYWHEKVGGETKMFYDDDVYHYEVGDLPDGNTEDVKGYKMTLRRAEAIMKREKKIVILDGIYGWVELTDYLKSVHGDTFNELIPMLVENKRRSLRLLFGKKAEDTMTGGIGPLIPLGFRNTKGNFCVWLATTLLVRNVNQAIAHCMIEKMRKFPDQVGEMSLKKSRKVNQLRKLTIAVEDIPTVGVRRYKKELSIFNVAFKKNGTRILPEVFLNRRKNNLCLVCGLLNGHSVGINLKDGLIWDPNFSNAFELTLENLDKCCGDVEYSGVEQVAEVYFKYK